MPADADKGADPPADDAGSTLGWSPGDKIAVSQCAICVHKRSGVHCDAFPDPATIPDAILTNQHDHREPYPGDHGIGFDPVT